MMPQADVVSLYSFLPSATPCARITAMPDERDRPSPTSASADERRSKAEDYRRRVTVLRVGIDNRIKRVFDGFSPLVAKRSEYPPILQSLVLIDPEDEAALIVPPDTVVTFELVQRVNGYDFLITWVPENPEGEGYLSGLRFHPFPASRDGRSAGLLEVNPVFPLGFSAVVTRERFVSEQERAKEVCESIIARTGNDKLDLIETFVGLAEAGQPDPRL